MRIRTLIVTACLLAAPLTARAADPPHYAAWRTEVLKATPSRIRGKLFRTYATDAHPERLERMIQDDNPDIAVRGYWERCNDKQPTGPPNLQGTPTEEYASKSLQRFFGFLEGRVQIRLPAWWEESISDEQSVEPPTKLHQTLWKHTTREGVDLKRTTDGVRLTINDTSIPLSPEVAKALEATEGDHITVLTTADRVLIAISSSTGARFPLLSINAATGQLLWRQDVWAAGTGNLGATSGFWTHRLELTADDRRVILFGSTGGDSYIELFELATGRPTFRFATNDWFALRGGVTIRDDIDDFLETLRDE